MGVAGLIPLPFSHVLSTLVPLCFNVDVPDGLGDNEGFDFPDDGDLEVLKVEFHFLFDNSRIGSERKFYRMYSIFVHPLSLVVPEEGLHLTFFVEFALDQDIEKVHFFVQS